MTAGVVEANFELRVEMLRGAYIVWPYILLIINYQLGDNMHHLSIIGRSNIHTYTYTTLCIFRIVRG